MKQIEKIQSKLRTIFKKDKDIIFVYLFGSAVLNATNYESDIDFAVYLDKKKNIDFFMRRVSLIENIQLVLKRPVEIVVLNETRSIFFKFVIIKEGKVIFERNHSKRVDFELRTMQEYYDFQPFIEAYNKAYLKRALSK